MFRPFKKAFMSEVKSLIADVLNVNALIDIYLSF